MDDSRRRRNRLYGVVVFTMVVVLFILVWLAGRDEDSFGGPRIAVLPLEGEIVHSRAWIRQLDTFAGNRRVAALLIPIDSPGGRVAPSQEIYQAIRRVRDQKDIPVVVSLGSVAASGGYYAALGADSIFANPGSMTGSIGVVMQFPMYGELMEKVGVRMQVVKSEAFKDAGTPFRKMTDEERRYFKDIVDDVYDQFVTVVEEERALDRQTLLPLATGQVFSGRQAYRYGLVDALGGFREAREAAAGLAGVALDTPLLYPPEERRSIVNRLWDDVTSVLPAGSLQESIVLAYRLPY